MQSVFAASTSTPIEKKLKYIESYIFIVNPMQFQKFLAPLASRLKASLLGLKQEKNQKIFY